MTKRTDPPKGPRKIQRDHEEREQLFIEQYLILNNGTKAAEAVGYKDGKWSAWNILRRPHVQEQLRIARAELSSRTKLSAEWIEKRLMGEADHAAESSTRVRALELLAKRISFFEPERFEISEMTPEQREAIKARILARNQAKE